MKRTFLFAAICLLFISTGTRGADLLSGPVVGHTTTTSARIWIETNEPTEFRVLYWQEPRIQYRGSIGEPVVKGEALGVTAADAPHTGIAELKDLKPGWLIYYEIELDGRLIRPATPQVFSLMPPGIQEGSTSRPADISVAFASCMFPARVPIQPIWNRVSAYRPDAMVLLGDNNYMPNEPGAYETDQETISYVLPRYHRFLRDIPGLRSLMATTPTYGIWDDHDFGPNNSDRTFRWRDLSLEYFKRYYPNRSAGLPETPGLFTSFQIADAEFFLLDDRYYRDPNDAPDRKTMFGEGQLNWLKDSLKSSSATFKIIANGSSMLVDRRGSGEYWANFGNERDEFIDWLFSNQISGVVFVVGDWHVGTLSRLYRPKDNYPLYELLTSNSAVTPEPQPAGYGQGHYRFHQFVSPEFQGFNFGLVELSGETGSRSISLKIIDTEGEARVRLTLKESDLSGSGAGNQ